MDINIDKLSLLARLKLGDKEKEKFKEEFEAILGYIGHLEEADTSSVDSPKAGRATEGENITREDEGLFNKSGDNSEVLLKEAPMVQDGFVKVKNVFNK